MSEQSANCREKHWPNLSCAACGWTELDDWVFLDSRYKPVPLQKKVEFLLDNSSDAPQWLKTTLFWLKGGNIHNGD